MAGDIPKKKGRREHKRNNKKVFEKKKNLEGCKNKNNKNKRKQIYIYFSFTHIIGTKEKGS